MLTESTLFDFGLVLIQNKLIVEQKWPEVDDNHELPVFIMLGSKQVDKCRVPAKTVKALKVDDALDLMNKQESLKKLISEPFENYKITFENEFPLRATLTFLKLKAQASDK
jgi:hypothetical protein